ncbi:hypothetical protein DF044_38445 [Burkholderia contaminans]|uniref:hypothetical protein n=1 Tax=Burkholderia contaminans TaxID=488447 RepID=UPI000F5A59D0|nr:hypothetical protein [Burkholderia contaminans]RQT01765.1 hypothetical protein DF044_38445 [Burkholderia contaminans]
MTPPLTNLTDSTDVRQLLLDDGRTVRAEFAAALDQELGVLADGPADCFRCALLIKLAVAALRTQRTTLLAELVFGTLDDMVVSTQLVFTGKAAAAGNVARQAIEGLAMELLCSVDSDLVVERRPKQGDRAGRYWELVLANDRLVETQRAVRQVEWNAARLGLTPDDIAYLASVRKHWSAVRHAGVATIADRSALNGAGALVLGSSFDLAKLG